MRRLSLVCLVLICLVWLAGCGSTDDLVVAEVAGKRITGRDLKTAATKLRSYEGTKTKVLWTLIDKELLLLEAYNRGLDTSKTVLTQLKRAKRSQMIRLLKAKLARGIQVSEAEIQQYYRRWGLDKKQEVRARHILVGTRQEAEEILKQLKQGADFAKLARERSLDRASAEKGGDLGYWEEGTVWGPTAKKVFSMKVGEISEPFQSRWGFHIIEVLDRRPVGLEKQRKAISNRIKHAKAERKFQNYLNNLRDEIKVRIDQQTLALLLRGTSGRGNLSLGDEQRARMLVRYDGKGITLGEYIEWVNKFVPRRRPDLTDSLQVVASLDWFVRSSVLLPEAFRREKIENSKELQSYLKKRRQKLMVTELQRMETEAKVITAEAIREYYENYRDLYVKPPRISVEGVLTKDLKDARQALQQIKAGVDMVEVARRFPVPGWKNYNKFSFYANERSKLILGTPIVELTAQANVGDIIGPYKPDFEKGNQKFLGYAIDRILAKEPGGQRSLDEPKVREDVIRRLKAEKKEELNKLFDELIAQLRAKYSQQTVVYEKALKALPELTEVAKKSA